MGDVSDLSVAVGGEYRVLFTLLVGDPLRVVLLAVQIVLRQMGMTGNLLKFLPTYLIFLQSFQILSVQQQDFPAINFLIILSFYLSMSSCCFFLHPTFKLLPIISFSPCLFVAMRVILWSSSWFSLSIQSILVLNANCFFGLDANNGRCVLFFIDVIILQSLMAINSWQEHDIQSNLSNPISSLYNIQFNLIQSNSNMEESDTLKRTLIKLTDNTIQKYILSPVNSSLSLLPLEYFYCAGAPFSGPIALLFNKNMPSENIKFAQSDKSAIIFFTCKGERKRAIPFQFRERIMYFGFQPDERLLIILANGRWYIVDGHTGQIRDGAWGDGKDRIVGVQVIKQLVVLVRQRTVAIVQKVDIDSTITLLTGLRPSLDNIVFSLFQNQEGNLKIIYLNKDASIEEFDIQTKESNILLKNIDKYGKQNSKKLIAIGRSKQNLSLLLQPSTAYYLNLMKQPSEVVIHALRSSFMRVTPMLKSSTNFKYKSHVSISWIGEACVFIDSGKLAMWDSQKKYEQQYQSKVIPVNQIDGIRIIANTNNLYRAVSEEYLALINPKNYSALSSSHQIGQQPNLQSCSDLQLISILQQLYFRYTHKEVLFLSSLKAIPMKKLPQLCENLLSAISLLMSPLQQMIQLKFLLFLKAHFSIGEDINVNDLVEQLRLINQLKFEEMGRMMTVAQLRYVRAEGKPTFINVMLRYNMHYIADVVYGDWEAKEIIFLHWAKCKISKELEVSEVAAVPEIKARFDEMDANRSTKVFTILAKWAIDRNKLSLALRLIDYERNAGRRVMVALLILVAKQDVGYVDKILQYAQQSFQSSIIYQVMTTLLRCVSWLPIDTWVSQLHKKPILQTHYLKYLRDTQRVEQIKNYYIANKMYTQLGYDGIQMRLIGKTLEESKEIAYQFKNFLPSLGVNLSKCQQKGNIISLRDLLKKQYPITQADCAPFQSDLDLQYLAQIIQQKDENTALANKMIRKIKSQKVYTLLLRRGKIRDAMDLAYERKNKEMLAHLIDSTNDQQLQNNGNDLLRLLNAKKPL